MLTVAEALSLVLEHATPKPPVSVSLDKTLGHVLAEDVASDVDSPPHDKAMVDGYAVVAADLAAGPVELDVVEEVTAGKVPTLRVARGSATRIMTGAPIPDGADAVVMIEHTQAAGGRLVRIDDAQLAAGANIMPRGTSLRVGQRVLTAGTMIRPIEIGVLAEVGRQEVSVVPCPAVAVLPTGDELVPASETPAPGQIRNSNGPLLTAAARRAGATAIELETARDDESKLCELIAAGLAHDVLLLSGGVSAGVKDLVPKVLAQLHVDEVFHKVRLKPGKPLWFGVAQRGDRRTLVFGLPGNPVSSFVCFEIFVRAALDKLAGRTAIGLKQIQAELTFDFEHRGDRTTYYPAKLVETNSGAPRLELINWHGSADLASLVAANALAVFPVGDARYNQGDVIDAVLLS